MNKLYFITKLAGNLNAIGLSINESAVLAAIYSRSDDAQSITTKKLKEILGIRSLVQTFKVLGNMIQRVSMVKGSDSCASWAYASIRSACLCFIFFC